MYKNFIAIGSVVTENNTNEQTQAEKNINRKLKRDIFFLIFEKVDLRIIKVLR